MSIEFLFYSCTAMVFFFSLNVVFLLVGFSFFLLIICRRCFVCIYLFITLVSGFVYFGRAGSLGVSLVGRVIFFLRGAPLCGVSGRYNLFER